MPAETQEPVAEAVKPLILGKIALKMDTGGNCVTASFLG